MYLCDGKVVALKKHLLLLSMLKTVFAASYFGANSYFLVFQYLKNN